MCSDLTWAELDALVDRYATGLLAHGVGRDDIVMIQLPNVVELIATYLAVGRLGAILSPVPVQYRAHELRYVIDLAEPKAFITTNRFEGFDHLELARQLRATAPKPLTVIGDAADPGTLPEDVVPLAALLATPADTEAIAAHRRANEISADDVFTVCWTSGTEADPKGVPRSHNLWISIALATVDGGDIREGEPILCPFPVVKIGRAHV